MPGEFFSVAELLAAGERMLAHGWKSSHTPPDSPNLYVWTSPRGAEYYTGSINLPNRFAVKDAYDNEDIQRPPKQEFRRVMPNDSMGS